MEPCTPEQREYGSLYERLFLPIQLTKALEDVLKVWAVVRKLTRLNLKFVETSTRVSE
jgi:hypothetical protein